jgi:hypothetical protein
MIEDNIFPPMEQLLKTHDDFWIDGPTYENKEEIKAWGGYWNPDKKRWQIDSISEDDIVRGTLYRMGLKLIKIEK